MQQFLETPRIKLLHSDSVTAQYYAKIYKQLRISGKPIPTNDMWIAATAMQYRLILLTYDKHFVNIEGLSCGQQLSDFLPSI